MATIFTYVASTEHYPPFDAYKGPHPYIFVSYAHKDSGLVFSELERMKGLGFNIWYDEGIDPGNEWPKQIASALIASAVFVLFVSERSVRSVNCRNEVYLAAQVKKPFLAIYLEETDVVALDAGLALTIGSIQGIMRYRMREESLYDRKLRTALQDLLDTWASPSAGSLAREPHPELIKSPLQKTEGLTIPKAFLSFAQAGTVLKLTPVSSPSSKKLYPIHLSSRKTFKIGRKRDGVDFAAWFLPRSKENDEQTLRITSLHCSLDWRDDGVWLIDNKATNCTYLNRHQVIGETPFTGPAEIGLAGTYFIEATPFSISAPQGPVISNIRSWAGPDAIPQNPPFGSLRLVAKDKPEILYHAVWLLAEGTLGTSLANPVVLEIPGLADIQARLYYHKGCYWLGNIVENGAVRINSIEIKAKDVVPLVTGQTLTLGAVSYRVDVAG